MRKTYFKSEGYSFEVETRRVRGRAVEVRRVRNRDGIAVIPLLGGNKIIMERQHRPVIGRWSNEIPQGHIERGESKQDAVRRELREETGYVASNVRFLFKAYTDVGVETQMQYYFLADVTSRSKAHLDPDEVISARPVRISDVEGMIARNEIRENTTLCGLLYYLFYYKVKGSAV